MKIFIMEDLSFDGLKIKDMLNEYDTLSAWNDIEATRILDMNPDINLIILDLDIASMENFEMLVNLKFDAKYREIPIIIVTNINDLEKEIIGLKLGATDYLRRPIKRESLIARVNLYSKLLKGQYLEEKMRKQDTLFQTIFQQSPIGIAISHYAQPLDINEEIVTNINPKYEEITGRTAEELIKLGWAKITHPDDVEKNMKNYRKIQSGEARSYSMEKRFIKPDGSIVWVNMIVSALNLFNKGGNNQISLIQDITDQKQVEIALLESERNKSILFSYLPGLGYRCKNDSDWTMEYVSQGCFDLTGYPSESLLYNKDIAFKDLVAPEYLQDMYRKWAYVLTNKLTFKDEYEIITVQGERKWVMEMGQGIYTSQGQVTGIEGILLDISDRKRIENSLRYNIEHDSWTGLYNRHYLQKVLKEDIQNISKEKKALISINLSALQSLIMTYGFNYTQDLIKEAADLLGWYSIDNRLLFRTYENRYVFYLKGYSDKDELISFCKCIIDTLDPLLKAEGVGAGIGVFEIDERRDTDIDQLLKKLLIASERATDLYDREFGICFYDKKMEEKIIREENIKQELVSVGRETNDGGLFLLFQPILELKSNRICAFEALARLDSSKYGLISPMEFIPIAEKTKLIIPVGQKILRQAFEFQKILEYQGYSSVKISTNISILQLLKRDFIEELLKIMNEIKVSPDNIILEITESVFASNYEDINIIISKLKNLGFHIAIDDFGTGYSSLARSEELNIDILKIDKYFTDRILLTDSKKDTTRDIISMAHKQGHIVIAEGVECEKQRQYLYSCGCDKIQGYLIGRPLSKEAAIEMLEGEGENYE